MEGFVTLLQAVAGLSQLLDLTAGKHIRIANRTFHIAIHNVPGIV